MEEWFYPMPCTDCEIILYNYHSKTKPSTLGCNSNTKGNYSYMVYIIYKYVCVICGNKFAQAWNVFEWTSVIHWCQDQSGTCPSVSHHTWRDYKSCCILTCSLLTPLMCLKNEHKRHGVGEIHSLSECSCHISYHIISYFYFWAMHSHKSINCTSQDHNRHI